MARPACSPPTIFQHSQAEHSMEHSLTNTANAYGRSIRAAVRILAGALDKDSAYGLEDVVAGSSASQSESFPGPSNAESAAWGIVSVWLTGVATNNLTTDATLSEAEEWFLVSDAPIKLSDLWPTRVMREAEAALLSEVDPETCRNLLPYTFDPHGPGSRVSVMRDPATVPARAQKRAGGVFYTPVDVAQYMVGNSFASLDRAITPTVYDPACGTGVFLKAALWELRSRHRSQSTLSLASEHLFGTDIASWPLDASALVLLAEILVCDGVARKPHEVWRALRRNLRCMDALMIEPISTAADGRDANDAKAKRVTLPQLFPAMKEEPAVIVGNPPYADIGDTPYAGQIVQNLETMRVKPQPNAEIYVGFVEQMVRLANKKQFSGGLVLPLSVAYSIGPQFVAVRQLMQRTPGHWRFAFFDREPQALFGEDVKTRNAIVFWDRDASTTNPVIASGPLRRWRRPSRSSMFERIKFTEISAEIQGGIPKLEGCQQVHAFETLNTRWERLERAVRGVGRVSLADALSADDRTIFVGSTAYNFLNVFLRPPRTAFPPGTRLSENPLYGIACVSKKDALVVFGMLTSHLAYWWWQTSGDGFHVSKRFLTDFPFGADVLEGPSAELLSTTGAALWGEISADPIISLNRGRTSLGYDPTRCADMRRVADAALVDVAGLASRFVDELQRSTDLTRTANH